MIRALIALATIVFGRFSFCAKSGAIVGVIAGFLFGLLQLALEEEALSSGNPVHALTGQELVLIGLALGLLGWIALLMMVGVWLRYGAAAIAWPAFVNSLITALLTVLVNDRLNLPSVAGLIGLAVGLIVGTLLCLLCDRWRRSTDKIVRTTIHGRT